MILWYTAIVLLAGVLGAISYKLFAHLHSRPLARLLAACTVLLALGLAGRSLLEVNLVAYLLQRAQYAGRRETFAGDSNALGSTAIIPTLDTPCPANKNVIWCSSFQLAWNQMKTDIFDGPVPVLGAEDLAGRLNGAGQSAADLEPQSYYAATGWSDQGIASQIEKDMAARFPNHALPELGDGEGIIMYSYVRANVPFEYPFLEADAGFHFTDSLGNRTTVRGFGMWEGDLPRNEDASRQVEVLYYHSSESDSDSETTEFAVDMCRFSSPYQVVIASVPFEGSLTGTCEYVRDRIDAYQASPSYDQNSGDLGGLDVLLVPEMFWKIEHHFPELIGKTVAYGGTAIPIMEAMQTVSFRLDRHGAMLESESAGFYGGLPRYLICDRPFLVYMQKRGAEHPFFVMWVDNAELLTRR